MGLDFGLGSSTEVSASCVVRKVMEDFDNKVIAHELIHVMWHFAEECNLEMNYNSQEWQAILFEYLFTQCQFDNSFTQLPK
jgi:predicted SprT family Zn-dependent metalloprotease